MDMPTTSKNVSDPARGCEDLVLSSAFGGDSYCAPGTLVVDSRDGLL